MVISICVFEWNMIYFELILFYGRLCDCGRNRIHLQSVRNLIPELQSFVNSISVLPSLENVI